MGKRRNAPGRRIAWIAGLILLCVLTFFAAKKSDPKKLLEIVRHASLVWLGIAAALQAGTYLCAAAVLRLGLRTGKAHFLRLVPLGLMKIFVDQALPTAGT